MSRMQVDKPYAKPYVLRGHDREVTAVAWCPTDAHSIATCGDDATVKLWNVQRPWPPAPQYAPQVGQLLCQCLLLFFLWSHVCNGPGLLPRKRGESPLAPCCSSSDLLLIVPHEQGISPLATCCLM